ncbi:MAG: hypothetical protein IPJ34_29950 [Myxococcales bacterium]|nr:hypothetical protein [Myxococcales bacterium]
MGREVAEQEDGDAGDVEGEADDEHGERASVRGGLLVAQAQRATDGLGQGHGREARRPLHAEDADHGDGGGDQHEHEARHDEDRAEAAAVRDAGAGEAGDGDGEAGELEQHLRAPGEDAHLPLDGVHDRRAVARVEVEEVLRLLVDADGALAHPIDAR